MWACSRTTSSSSTGASRRSRFATADELATVLAGAARPARPRGSADVRRRDGVRRSCPRSRTSTSRLIERYFGGRGLLVSPDIKSGMPIRIDRPQELGADRLANAVAAYDRVRRRVHRGRLRHGDQLRRRLGRRRVPRRRDLAGDRDLAGGAGGPRRAAAAGGHRGAAPRDRQGHRGGDPGRRGLRLRRPGRRDPRAASARSSARRRRRSPPAATRPRSCRSASRSTRWTTCSRCTGLKLIWERNAG